MIRGDEIHVYLHFQFAVVINSVDSFREHQKANAEPIIWVLVLEIHPFFSFYMQRR